MNNTFPAPTIPSIFKAIRAALEVTQYVQSSLTTSDTVIKNDHSPVTVADLAAQVIINQSLYELDPNVRIVGEEDSSPLKEDPTLAQKVLDAVRRWRFDFPLSDLCLTLDRGNCPGGAQGSFWTLDPIDGTKGFLRGEQYALALARIQNGVIQQGFLGCPNLPPSEDGFSTHQIFYAERGAGAWGIYPGSSPTKLTVTSAHDLADARFCESVEKAHSSHSSSSHIAQNLGIQKAPYRIDSQCKYAAVARGDAAIYLRLPVKAGYQEKIWDHAAGVLLVEEAGGRVTDVYGQNLDFSQGRTLANNTGVVVTNATLHERTMRAVQQELNT